jgi:hypothetical protein
MTVVINRPLLSRVVVALSCAVLAGCPIFPAPTPPVPLTKSQVTAVAKCEQAVKKGRLGFIKTKLAALDASVDSMLALRLQFENGLIDQAAFDAGIPKLRDKAHKGYAKITAASTKFVDGVVKACTPVEEFVLGPYDALRFRSQTSFVGQSVTTTAELAGVLCTETELLTDAVLWETAPRNLELLGYLGAAFVFSFGTSAAAPNVPLDPRCLALNQLEPTPTATPSSVATPSPTPTP